MKTRSEEIISLLKSENLSNEERKQLLIEQKGIWEDRLNNPDKYFNAVNGHVNMMKNAGVDTDEEILTDAALDYINMLKKAIQDNEKKINNL